MIAFDSLNPYETMGYIIGRDPSDLVQKLREIRTPIKIHFIVAQGSNHVAYFTGDVKAKKVDSDVNVAKVNTGPRVRKIRPQ